MRVLLDECVPKRLKEHLAGYECQTVPEAGFAGRTNGELLSLAQENGFAVFLTIDQGIAYQQNLQRIGIAVILIRAKSSRLLDLLAKLPEVLSALQSIQPGALVRIG